MDEVSFSTISSSSSESELSSLNISTREGIVFLVLREACVVDRSSSLIETSLESEELESSSL